jgi:hypothetical protein
MPLGGVADLHSATTKVSRLHRKIEEVVDHPTLVRLFTKFGRRRFPKGSRNRRITWRVAFYTR